MGQSSRFGTRVREEVGSFAGWQSPSIESARAAYQEEPDGTNGPIVGTGRGTPGDSSGDRRTGDRPVTLATVLVAVHPGPRGHRGRDPDRRAGPAGPAGTGGLEAAAPRPQRPVRQHVQRDRAP